MGSSWNVALSFLQVILTRSSLSSDAVVSGDREQMMATPRSDNGKCDASRIFLRLMQLSRSRPSQVFMKILENSFGNLRFQMT